MTSTGAPDFARMGPDQMRRHRERRVLLRLLLRVSQIETAELVRRLAARGHPEVQRSYVAVLANIDTEGTRLVEIARRLGNTRQAASQMVREIESRGLLVREPDPDDGRATRVRHTDRGRALLADALATMAEIEREYAEVTGPETLDVVRDALWRIADAADRETAL